MKVKELLSMLKYEDENSEIAVWDDSIEDYLDFYIILAGQRKSRKDWGLAKTFVYIHPIITNDKFHYFEYENIEDNNHLSKEELMTPLERFNKKYEIH